MTQQKIELQCITEFRALDWFKPDPKELARHDDPQKVRLLGEDMLANGQLQAVGAINTGPMIGSLIFGHGRWLAATAVGIKTLETKLYPASLTETQFRLIRLAENIHRQDMTAFQKWVACTELLCGNNWGLTDLAGYLHLDPSSVTRLMSPSKCIEAVQNALRDGKIGISDCYAISKLELPSQAGLLALKLSGASRDTIEAAGRKTRNAANGEVSAKAGGKKPVKVAKVKCLLPSGYTVTVSGGGVSLDDAAEALADAIKEMKRARDMGYTAKTFALAMADKSKKG